MWRDVALVRLISEQLNPASMLTLLVAGSLGAQKLIHEFRYVVRGY